MSICIVAPSQLPPITMTKFRPLACFLSQSSCSWSSSSSSSSSLPIGLPFVHCADYKLQLGPLWCSGLLQLAYHWHASWANLSAPCKDYNYAADLRWNMWCCNRFPPALNMNLVFVISQICPTYDTDPLNQCCCDLCDMPEDAACIHKRHLYGKCRQTHLANVARICKSAQIMNMFMCVCSLALDECRPFQYCYVIMISMHRHAIFSSQTRSLRFRCAIVTIGAPFSILHLNALKCNGM